MHSAHTHHARAHTHTHTHTHTRARVHVGRCGLHPGPRPASCVRLQLLPRGRLLLVRDQGKSRCVICDLRVTHTSMRPMSELRSTCIARNSWWSSDPGPWTLTHFLAHTQLKPQEAMAAELAEFELADSDRSLSLSLSLSHTHTHTHTGGDGC